ncbi:DUF333 domain-containing protein [Yersinia ruckeri]|uniref:Putative lipoprotein n=1 Tax=Yersinia ruckeri TaxID=29486 RepID=A0A085U7Q2_YERRU|nr:DUF333 domain-containing protein [Yersinia ruckeri]AKA37287.1 lipoprotein [Yersinia ruckeri]ARZ00978.1 lipoprotein [Yersinia ruckeri]AUQ43061.1 DUF333 domain-containing protein [Yersinia ruckeri]EEQ00486.1 hypothetical protein yruck0001_13060 [Yersinia ruckeri ATCC 29473]EKN3347649.1 DUF333 domain-containing protein [Yersinia ruckeri]
MKVSSWLIAGTVLFLSACGSNSKNIPEQQGTSANVHQVSMANPASVNCANVGGVLTLTKQLDGGTIGMCQLPDGKRCEEWALMRGACPAS